MRNHVEVKSEEEVIQGVQWSNQHMISGAVSCGEILIYLFF